MNTNKHIYFFSDQQVQQLVQMNHRYDIIDEGVTFDYTASAIRFKAICTDNIRIKMRFLKTAFSDEMGKVAFSIFIDGIRQPGYHLVEGLVDREEYIFEFFVGDELKEREIEFVRQSERVEASINLISLELDGQLICTLPRDLLVEFLGDSVTCGGANNSGEKGNGHVDDGTYSYAFLSAHDLGLDYRMVSNGGFGLKYSSSGNTGPRYEWISSYDYQNYMRNTEKPYIHRRNADVVCICLGTNDSHSRMQGTCNWTDEEWAEFAKEMIVKVKGYNPNAKIVWLVGGMSSVYGTAAEIAIKNLGGESKGYYVCRIPDTYHDGGAWHPSAEQHIIMAEKFKRFLEETIL